jgi:pimeloyl-ACP methyl ester carboxylesterase
MTEANRPDPVRAQGPHVVTEGRPDDPTLIVLDPSGAGKHDEIPATWRPLSQRRRILWCRLPVEGALSEADEILGDASGGGAVIDVVASGPFADTALLMAERHSDVLRSLLLVDPAAEGFLEADQAPEANRDWEEDTAQRRRRLEELGVVVRLIAQSTGGSYDRVAAPLPLGHPDVVAALGNALDEFRA